MPRSIGFIIFSVITCKKMLIYVQQSTIATKIWSKQAPYFSDLQNNYSLHMELQAIWIPAGPALPGSHPGLSHCWRGSSYLENILILMAEAKNSIPTSQAHFKPCLPITCKHPIEKKGKLNPKAKCGDILHPERSHSNVVPVITPPQGWEEVGPITHSTTAWESSCWDLFAS